MFETSPTTQRAAEQSALTDLKDPQLTVDPAGKVVNLNNRAKQLFNVGTVRQLPIVVSQLIGVDLETLLTNGEIEIDGTDGGIFAVSHTQLTDSQGDAVGSMVVLYDVTEERQQKQQLSVLNRVLRHNLRNEMTVIQGSVEMVASETTDSQLSTVADRAVDSSHRLLSIAEKVRDFDQVQDNEINRTEVNLLALVDDIITDFESQYPTASITVDIEGSQLPVWTDPKLLSLIVSNLLENAIVHADSDSPEVSIHLTESEDNGNKEDMAVIELRDINQPISETELAPLREGDESSLQHSSGIGLWIVTWCVTNLNGEIEFQYDKGNVITVTVPSSTG